ncbi:MAG: hypothetical protein KBG48_12215 [Kofleriaceae bacterium]|nr:hypothetical protein [Kofleriaceae bacterium]MBP9168150.1 hypothetical protein [Kofleriaceae bacterium]MBP9856472.1 hypothetical protein [Kofleriaceae bacterium]
MVSPRLLVVVHTGRQVAVTIKGALPGAPVLAVVGPQLTYTVEPKDGAWVTSLQPGTYLLRIDAASDAPAAPLALTADQPITFTTYRELRDHAAPPEPRPDVKTTRSWTATTVEVGGDVKDPWPPPGAGKADEPWSSWIVRSADRSVPRGA